MTGAAMSECEMLRSILAQHFSTTDPALLASVEAAAEWRRLKAGDILFEQGETTSDIYFVLHGRLRAIAREAGNVKRVLGDIGRGETLGELAMLTGQPRSASIVAVRDTTLAKLTRDAFEDALAHSPKIAMRTMQIVIERFRRQERAQRRSAAPVNVCLLPVTPHLDANAFAARLAACFPDRGAIAALSPGDFPPVPAEEDGAAEWREEAGRRLHIVEANHATVLTVADAEATPWTDLCLQSADEILLLADAAGPRAVVEAERVYLTGEHPLALGRQTLVLLHGLGEKAPRDTAAWLDRRPVSRHFHIRPQRGADMARLVRILTGRAVGLVLSGGGARGLAQIGVINALAEAGIDPDFVGGTSMGSVIAAWCAMEVRGEALVRAGARAFGVNPSGDYNFLPLISLVRGKRTMDITRKEIFEAAGADIDSADTWRTFFCVASNYTASAEAVLKRGPLARNVVASYSIPGVFPPQIIGGQMMFDGGTFNNFPVDVMERMGAGRIIGVDMLNEETRTIDSEDIPGSLAFALDLMRPYKSRKYRLPVLFETLLTASFVSSVAKQREMRERTDLYLRPAVTRVSMLDWKKLPQIVQMGYDSAKAQLAAMSEAELAPYR